MSEKQYKVIGIGDVPKKKPRKSPAAQIVESLEGDYLTVRQMADKVGVHPETMRRLCRTDKVSAPSNAVRSGDMTIYLFSSDDVQEITEYFSKKGYVIKND